MSHLDRIIAEKLFPRTEHARKIEVLNEEFKAFVRCTNVCWDNKYYEDYEQDMRYEQWKMMREMAYDSD